MPVIYIPSEESNLDTLNGYTASVDPQPNTIPASRTDGKLDPGWYKTPFLEMDEKYKITSILIPLYIYPSDIQENTLYNNLIDLVKRYKQVDFCLILNPENGPGTVVDDNYTVAIRRLRAAGATVVGYVYTNYTSRPISEVKQDINTWISFYPDIQGFFFDETPTQVSKIPYYKELYIYCGNKNKYPIILNPGTVVSKEWFDAKCADVIVIYESDGYPTEDFLRGNPTNTQGFLDVFYKKRAVLVYNVQYEATQVDLLKKYTGMFYITNDNVPNPWDTLPVYLEDIVNRCITGGAVITDADLLDGYNTSKEAEPNTVVVRTENGAIKSRRLILTASAGISPLDISSTMLVPNLNADMVDGYHASLTPDENVIPVTNSNGKLDLEWLPDEVVNQQTYTYTITPDLCYFEKNVSEVGVKKLTIQVQPSMYFYTPTQNTWSVVSGAGGTARGYLVCTGVFSAALSIGGFTDSYSSVVEFFNSAIWSLTAPLSQAKYGVGACGVVYDTLVFGGYNGSNLNTTELFNGSVWQTLSPTNPLTARSSLGGFGYPNSAVACGGATGSASNITQIFNGSTWSLSGNMITGRSLLGACGILNAGLTAAGYTTENTNVSEKFNGSIWVSTTAYGTALQGLGLTGNQNAALGSGGWTTASVNTVYKFNGTTWTTTGALATARSNHGSCSTQNAALVFGGWTTTYTNVTERFNFQIAPVVSVDIRDNRSEGTAKQHYTILTNQSSLSLVLLAPVSFSVSLELDTALSLTAPCTYLDIYSWSFISSLNTARSSCGSAGFFNSGLVFGGTNGSLLQTCENYNGDSWFTPVSMSVSRTNLTGCGTLYSALAIGGNTGTYSALVEWFNGLTWSSLQSTINQAREGLTGVGVKNNCLISGGFTGTHSNTTERYDGTTWSVVNSITQSKSYLAGVGTSCAALITGGTTDSAVNVTEKYNGKTWSQTGTLTVARSNLAACGVQNACTSYGGVSSNVTERFTGLTWITTHSLLQATQDTGDFGAQNQCIAAGGYSASSYISICEAYTPSFMYRYDSCIVPQFSVTV